MASSSSPPADIFSGITQSLNSTHATLTLPIPPADRDHLENQVLFLFDNHGQLLNVTTTYIDAFNNMLVSTTINYATQIGATFIMLAIMLLMTPRRRFKRLPTIISLLALCINLIRVVLLALFFPSHWTDFYVLYSGDWQFVPPGDMQISVAATVLSIPVTALLLSALMVQAWSMMQLWTPLWRALVVLVSGLLSLVTVAMSFANCIFQAKNILYADPLPSYWVRKLYLALTTGSISWFTFLFMIRLVMHMWTNRSILPSMKGLKAMDVLIITNSILMLIPVLFAGLEFLDSASGFESGSLTQTSVVIVLPLGTLVAQRIATRGYMPDSLEASSGPNGSLPLSNLSFAGGGGGGSGGHKDKENGGGIIPPTTNNTAATNFSSSIACSGISCLPKVKRMTASSASSSQRPLLTMTNSTIASNDSSGFPSPGIHNTTTTTTQYQYSMGMNMPNFPPVPFPGYQSRTTGVTSHIVSDGRHHQGMNRHPSVDHFDRELARIDDEDDDGYPFASSEKAVMHGDDDDDVERGRRRALPPSLGGVRVERTIETRSEERMPSPDPLGVTKPRSFE
ncbi:pheromone receptor [Neurospora crassa]|uniref:Pheromone receptor n=2 Tax=Neurospora crassa TaxID=5141 RepID=Q1K6I3_NEUCR|nr:pheromone receptor [Neurospora crassa OR74A]EAA30497.1 pheromone receptor [Neurospora crassa OR74A]KHE86667.1 pheromone receptor [Neurospora crassa]CAC86431.1 pheromone receptor [Neurospora crassa]|eukprot:XP_959733.1 pheromone receptor [Neurospora crassa OR74A]